MRTGIASLVMIGVIAGPARAQPGMTPAAPPPAGTPQAATAVPPPYAYRPQPRRVVLSTDDADLLERGEVGDAAWIGGTFAALFVGFGAGQAIQGRWGDDGWMFTLGEPAAFILMGVGATEVFSDCGPNASCSDHERGPWLLVGGLVGFVGLRVWETVDAFVTPPSDNRHLRELRQQLGLPPETAHQLRPYLAPARGSASGGVAGVMLSF